MDKNKDIQRLIVDKVWEDSKRFILQEISSQGFRKLIVSALPIPLKYAGFTAMMTICKPIPSPITTLLAQMVFISKL